MSHLDDYRGPQRIAALLALLLAASYTDITRHKIYNWTTYPGIAIALGLSALGLGAADLSDSLAGLFACGDLGVSIREVAASEGLSVADKSLRELCEESEAVADLVRFATSLEYADARWRSGTSRSSAEELSVRAQ